MGRSTLKAMSLFIGRFGVRAVAQLVRGDLEGEGEGLQADVQRESSAGNQDDLLESTMYCGQSRCQPSVFYL